MTDPKWKRFEKLVHLMTDTEFEIEGNLVRTPISADTIMWLNRVIPING